jgi:hypothetical protein
MLLEDSTFGSVLGNPSPAFKSNKDGTLPLLISRKVCSDFLKGLPPFDPDLCWEWQKCRIGRGISRGYGRFWNGNTDVLSHRFAYEWLVGEIPSGMLVCHRCDNPPCCNPNHLFLGTQADNVRDCVNKERISSLTFVYPKGFRKLNPDQMRELFQLRKDGWSFTKLRSRFKITNFTIIRYLRTENPQSPIAA